MDPRDFTIDGGAPRVLGLNHCGRARLGALEDRHSRERGSGMRKAAVALIMANASICAEASAQGQAAPLAINVADPSVKWGPCPALFPGACEITVLQGDPSKPNADVVLRVGPGYTLPRHKHSSAERMILLEGELRVKYDGSDAVTLLPSTYAYGPAGLPHEGVCTSSTACT